MADKEFGVKNVKHDKIMKGHSCNCRSHDFLFKHTLVYDKEYSKERVGGDPVPYFGWSHKDMDKVCKILKHKTK